MTRVKCRCDFGHQEKGRPPEEAARKSGGLARRPEPDFDRVSQAAGSRARLGDDGLESTKGSRETDSRHSADRWGFSGVRFRGTERPSRYRLLDREVEAEHHPNDGRRRHQFPASNGLSRCSGQSRALMEIPRRRWDLRPYPTPGCRDSPGLPALQTLQIRPGLVPPGPTPEYVPHWRRGMTPNTRRPVRGHPRKRRIFITFCFIQKKKARRCRRASKRCGKGQPGPIPGVGG